MPTYPDIANDFITQTADVSRQINEVQALAETTVLKPDIVENVERQVHNLGTIPIARAAELRDAEVREATRAYAQAPDPRPASERTADEAKLARLIAQAPDKRYAERYMQRAERADGVGAYQEALVYAQAAEAKGVSGAEELVNYLTKMLDLKVPERRDATKRRTDAVIGFVTIHRAVVNEQVALMEGVVKAYEKANDLAGYNRARKAVASLRIAAKTSALLQATETGQPYQEPLTGDIWKVRR